MRKGHRFSVAFRLVSALAVAAVVMTGGAAAASAAESPDPR
jgi:hypothetical protein